MEDTIGLRRSQTTIDRFFTHVWLLSVDAQSYQTWFGKLYAWSTLSLFRIFMFVHGLHKGRSSIEDYTQEANQMEFISSSNLTSDISATTLVPDKGHLFIASTNLFKLEVCLTVQTTCQSEIFSLLVNDDAPVEKLSDIIFYKTYYQAAKFHGQIQRSLFRQCLSIIHAAHVGVRSTLRLCKEKVSWIDDFLLFNQISQHLRFALVPSGDDKIKLGKHWTRMGFQGEDPCSDFRGVGKLGLLQLHHFCQTHPLYAQRMIEESGSLLEMPTIDQPWYPFALCSIHVTQFVCHLLESGVLERNLLQGQLQGDTGPRDFIHTFFCFVFVQCHLDWATGVDRKEITSVFQFEDFFKDFSAFLTQQLRTKTWNNDDFHPQLKWW